MLFYDIQSITWPRPPGLTSPPSKGFKFKLSTLGVTRPGKRDRSSKLQDIQTESRNWGDQNFLKNLIIRSFLPF